MEMPERETTWLESQILEPRLHSFEELVFCIGYKSHSSHAVNVNFPRKLTNTYLAHGLPDRAG